MFVPCPSPLSASFFYFTTFRGKMEKVFRKENPKALSFSFILLFLQLGLPQLPLQEQVLPLLVLEPDILLH